MLKMTEKSRHRVLQILKRFEPSKFQEKIHTLEEISSTFMILALGGHGPITSLMEIDVGDALVIQGIMAIVIQLFSDEEVKAVLAETVLEVKEKKPKRPGPDFSTIDPSLN